MSVDSSFILLCSLALRPAFRNSSHFSAHHISLFFSLLLTSPFFKATLLHHNKSLDASTISTDPAHSRTLATGLYLEGSAATAYVQDALQLMSPLLESLLLREAVL